MENVIKKLLIVWILLVVMGAPAARAASFDVTAGQTIVEPETEMTIGGDVENEPALVKDEVVEGVVTKVLSQKQNSYSMSQKQLDEEVEVMIMSGSVKGKVVQISYNRMLSEGERPLEVGDKIMVNRSSDGEGEDIFYVVDFVRTEPLLVLFLLFVGLVVLVGRWQGVQSLVGMALSFVILFSVLIPGIKMGVDPVLVAIGSSALIMLFTFYLSHGINLKTTYAVIGTLISLVLTGVLAKIFVLSTHLTGFASEEAVFLQFIRQGELNIQGILLAGILIGALGVLDDITISQSSIVYELLEANPKLSFYQLFNRAMRVGRDHISSLANTLILVYAGGALPLLLIFTFDKSRSFSTVISYEVVAEEVVRTLVGSIGLVAAVPITTFVAAKWRFGREKKVAGGKLK